MIILALSSKEEKKRKNIQSFLLNFKYTSAIIIILILASQVQSLQEDDTGQGDIEDVIDSFKPCQSWCKKIPWPWKDDGTDGDFICGLEFSCSKCSQCSRD